MTTLAQSAPPPDPARLDPARLDPDQASARILVIEASDFVADIVSSVLTSAGNATTVTRTAAEALAQSLASFDVVVASLDLVAAEPDLAVALAPDRREGADLVVVASPAAAGAAAAFAPDAVVSRPVRPRELLACIDKVVAQRRRIPVFDQRILDELIAVIGTGNATQLVGKLGSVLRSAPLAFAAPGDEMRIQAHNLKAAAGVLGLSRLARDCAILEETCVLGGEKGPKAEQVLASCAASLATLLAWEQANAAPAAPFAFPATPGAGATACGSTR